MSSSSSKIEVIWSPNKEENFATYSTELRVYTVQRVKEVSARQPALHVEDHVIVLHVQ